MDEPTTALTNKEIERLYQIIRGLSERGVAVVFVSHKLDEVFAVCDRIAVIRNGEIVADEYVDKFEKENLVYYMTGERIAEEPFRYTANAQEPLLQVERLSQPARLKTFLSACFPGEILGITGQLGSGRTELAKALFGIGKTSGRILVHGKEQHFRNIQDAKKAASATFRRTGSPRACSCSAASRTTSPPPPSTGRRKRAALSTLAK